MASQPFINDTQSLERAFRSSYDKWVTDAKGRLGDANAAAPRVVSKAFHLAWQDRKRLTSQEEFDAFIGAQIHHGATREVVGGQLQAARHRQPAGVEHGVVAVEALHVLAVGRSDAADRRDAETEQVRFRHRRIALEVALQPPLPLRHGEIVLRLREMIHSDIHVTGACQPADCQRENLQLRLGHGQVRVQGELWRAHCPEGADSGDRVRIVGLDGLTLEVAREP